MVVPGSQFALVVHRHDNADFRPSGRQVALASGLALLVGLVMVFVVIGTMR
jgi:hypothetical protein